MAEVVVGASSVAVLSDAAAEVVMVGSVVVESLAVLLREHPPVRATEAIRPKTILCAEYFPFAILT